MYVALTKPSSYLVMLHFDLHTAVSLMRGVDVWHVVRRRAKRDFNSHVSLQGRCVDKLQIHTL